MTGTAFLLFCWMHGCQIAPPSPPNIISCPSAGVVVWRYFVDAREPRQSHTSTKSVVRAVRRRQPYDDRRRFYLEVLRCTGTCEKGVVEVDEKAFEEYQLNSWHPCQPSY